MAVIYRTTLLVLLAALIGCGGNPAGPAPSSTGHASSISSPYLNTSMIGQTWTFRSEDGLCTAWIQVLLPPPSNYYPPGSIMLRFTKSSPQCYWGPGISAAWIDFVLSPSSDGSLFSMGWVAHFPDGLPIWAPYTPYASEVKAPSGQPVPYMIVPPPSLAAGQSLVYDTSYNRWDFNGDNFNSFVSGPPVANVSWKTVFTAGQSEQFEGACGHEIWTFIADRGIESIAFPNDRSAGCTANPSGTTLHRVP